MYPLIRRQVDLDLIENIKVLMGDLIVPFLDEEFSKEILELTAKGGVGDAEIVLEKYKMAITEVPISSNKNNSMRALEAYKSLLEGPYRFYASIICYAMIKAGNQHNSMWDKSKKMPETLKEVNDKELGQLILFLNAFGHTQFTDASNKTLRNASAHDKFHVLNDGSVTYWDRSHKQKTITMAELNTEIDDLVDLIYAMTQGIQFAFGVSYGFYQE